MKVVEVNCRKECACSASVGIWNYCDLEHVIPIHKGFKAYQVIYETSTSIAALISLKVPFLPFCSVNSLVVQILHNENTLKVINNMFGVPVLSTIRVSEIRRDYSVFEMSYKYIFKGWKQFLTPIFEPILKRLVVGWNDRQWKEDLPIKLRRQKVLRLGFKDFKGLPDKVEDRYYEGPVECKLPVPRLKGVIANIPDSLI